MALDRPSTIKTAQYHRPVAGVWRMLAVISDVWGASVTEQEQIEVRAPPSPLQPPGRLRAPAHARA